MYLGFLQIGVKLEWKIYIQFSMSNLKDVIMLNELLPGLYVPVNIIYVCSNQVVKDGS